LIFQELALKQYLDKNGRIYMLKIVNFCKVFVASREGLDTFLLDAFLAAGI